MVETRLSVCRRLNESQNRCVIGIRQRELKYFCVTDARGYWLPDNDKAHQREATVCRDWFIPVRLLRRKELNMKDESGTILKPCPECGEDEDLSIYSCRSMGLSEVSCDCGHIFQSRCFEENIGKHWNKHVKNYKA